MEWDEYGNPIQPQQQQGQGFDISPQWQQGQEWDEQGRPVQPQRQTPHGYNDVNGGLTSFASGLTLNANDELAGFTGGVTGAIGAGVRGEDMGEAYLRDYGRYSDQVRGYRDEYRSRHPYASHFIEGSGAAAPVAASLLMGQPEVAASRLAQGGLPRRMAEGATVGAGYGYGAGFAGADGSLDERMLGGNEGAGYGALFGGVLPPALRVAGLANEAIGRPAWEALTGAARRLPTVDPNAVGMSGGNIRRGNSPPPPPRPRRFDPVAGGTIERLANRSRQSAEQLERRFSEYRLNPQGQVLVDAFDQPGVQTLRSMTQSPGQTGQRAAEVGRQRFQQAPERILTELNRRMSVAETPEQALASLNSQYERVSAENYRPVFERRMSEAQRADVQRRLGTYADDPVFQDADARAHRIFNRDRNNETVTGAIDDNYARYLHYVKMGLDEAVSAAPIGSRGLQATEMRGVYQMRQRILEAIDNNVPGYREARAQWGGLVEAQEALTEGGTMLRMNSGAVRQRMQQLTPFARYHARVGFANEVATRVGLRGSVNGNRNVAEVLGSPEMQARVRAMFDNPQEAAAFLDTLNQQNTLMRNAQQWSGGSQTAANLAHADDNTTNALEAGIDLAQGRRTSAASRLRNVVTGGMQERANNRSGETLLRRVDNDEDFTRAVITELRRREAERLTQMRLGTTGAAGAGSQQGDRR